MSILRRALSYFRLDISRILLALGLLLLSIGLALGVKGIEPQKPGVGNAKWSQAEEVAENLT
jgi:hypothetical protein